MTKQDVSNKNFINEKQTTLQYLNENYTIVVQYEVKSNDDFISIEAKKEDEVYSYTFKKVMNYEDFSKLPIDPYLLKLYDTTEKIYFFILDAITESKMSIEKINKTFLTLVITSKFLGFSEPRTMEIELQKEDCDIYETVKSLCEKVNKLTKENKLLKFKLDNKIFQNENEINFIKERIAQIPGCSEKKISMKLKFRLSENGSSIIDFHKICDGIPNNLVLVKTTDGERFGGFTRLAWTSCNMNQKDDNAFCFSLTRKKVYNIIKGFNAIADYENFGPSFLDNMFHIGSRFNSLTYGNCTKNTRSNYLGERTTYEINNNKQFFIINEFEFYEIKFKKK